MGTNWSWPCGEREKRRYRVTTAKPKEDIKYREAANFNVVRVQTTVISSGNLDRFLRIHPKDSFPSCIIGHPSNPNDVIVISQHPDDIATFPNKQGSYGVSPLAINEKDGKRLCTLIQSNLNWANSANKTFIGAVTDNSGMLYLCYFKHEDILQGNSKYIVELIERPMTAEFLKEFINNFGGNLYKGCISYREHTFLVMEEPENPKQKIYAVLEFSGEDVSQPGFTGDASGRIDNAIAKQGLEFMGMASTISGISLVFAKK